MPLRQPSKTHKEEIQQIRGELAKERQDFLTAVRQQATSSMTKAALKEELRKLGFKAPWHRSKLKTSDVAEGLIELEAYADSIMAVLVAYGDNNQAALKGGLKKTRQKLLELYRSRTKELKQRQEALKKEWDTCSATLLFSSGKLSPQRESEYHARIRKARAELRTVNTELEQFGKVDLGNELPSEFLLQEYRRVFELFQKAKSFHEDLLNIKAIKNITQGEQRIVKKELDTLLKRSDIELRELDADVRRLQRNFAINVAAASRGSAGLFDHLKPRFTDPEEISREISRVEVEILRIDEELDNLPPESSSNDEVVSGLVEQRARLRSECDGLKISLRILEQAQDMREAVSRQVAEDLQEIETAKVELDKLREISRTARGLVIYMDVSQANYNNFVKIVRTLLMRRTNKLGPASLDVSFCIGMSVGVKQGGVSFKAGLALEIGAGVNVQDDRRFRTVVSFSFKAIAGVSFPFVFNATAALTLFKHTDGNVYVDEFQWAAWLAHRVSIVWALLRGAGKIGRINKAHLSPKEEELLIDTARQLLMNDQAREQFSRFTSLLQIPVIRTKSYLAGHVDASVDVLKLKPPDESVTSLSVATSVNTLPTYLHFYKPVAHYRQEGLALSRNSNQEYKLLKAKIREASLSVSLPGSLSATVKFNRIEKHANPDNDGDYINIAISKGCDFMQVSALDAYEDKGAQYIMNPFGAAAEDEIPGWMSSIGNSIEKMPDLNETFLGKIPTALQAEVPKSNIGQLLSGGKTLEFNFIRVGKVFRLQYSRLSLQLSYSADTSVPVPGLPFLLMDFAVGGKFSVTTREWLGTNTLSYVLTLFNAYCREDAMKPRRIVGNEDWSGDNLWKRFCQTYRKQLWRLICNIADEDSSIHGEAVGFKPALENLLQECRKLRITGKSTFNPVHFERLLKALEALLAKAQKDNDAARELDWTRVQKKGSSAREKLEFAEELPVDPADAPLKQKEVERRKKTFRDELEQDFQVVNVQGDGNCLFRAVAAAMGHAEDMHGDIRFNATTHMRNHPDLFPEGTLSEQGHENVTYLTTMQTPAQGAGDRARWGGGPELVALAQFYRRRIVVHAPFFFLGKHIYEEYAVEDFRPMPDRPDLHLYFEGGNHYMALVPRALGA